MPPLEWGAPLESCEAAVAAEQEEGRACGWGWGEAAGEECLLANMHWYGGLAEVDSVGDAEGLGFGSNDAMAVVMLKGNINVESVRAAEIPGAASGWLVVVDDGTAE